MNSKIISVVTSTRADYGLLKPLLEQLYKNNKYEILLYVTGMHLSYEFGNTYHEIEADGFKIAKKIPILLADDSFASMSKTMGIALIEFSTLFEEKRPDLVIILGDRYEIMAVAEAAMVQRIPIAHICGGEVTEGAIDDSIRHAITKMSFLHFVSTDIFRKRVIQLGENPERVFNVGALSVDNIRQRTLYTKTELEQKIGFQLGERYAVVTYHSPTLGRNVESKVEELIYALNEIKNMNYIITKSNADAGGRLINSKLKTYAEANKNKVIFVDSLGNTGYLSALKYCQCVIGNSSSGIVEAPIMGVPTVNIGERQQGRIKLESVIDCEEEKEAIIAAIEQAVKIKNSGTINKDFYGEGKTAEKIVSILDKWFRNEKNNFKKKFYDIDFVVRG